MTFLAYICIKFNRMIDYSFTKILFYLCGIVFIYANTLILFYRKYVEKMCDRFDAISELDAAALINCRFSEIKEPLAFVFFIENIALSWLFFGLFSSQWILFVMFLMVYIFIADPIHSFFYNKFKTTLVDDFAIPIFSILFGVFVLANDVFLKIDVKEMLVNLFL